MSDPRGVPARGYLVVTLEVCISRVLSTTAKAAIGQVKAISDGGFRDQISALDAQGKVCLIRM